MAAATNQTIEDVYNEYKVEILLLLSLLNLFIYWLIYAQITYLSTILNYHFFTSFDYELG